jgi:hypothetical protein
MAAGRPAPAPSKLIAQIGAVPFLELIVLFVKQYGKGGTRNYYT